VTLRILYRSSSQAETNAQSAITGSRAGEAQVHAILALASAVNRLAAAAEAIAAAQT
jgi:hypothetical protein